MREAAMMREGEHRPFEGTEYVKIRRLGRERHSRGGQGGLAIESSAGEAGSGQEVGDGFQVDFLSQFRIRACLQACRNAWSSDNAFRRCRRQLKPRAQGICFDMADAIS